MPTGPTFGLQILKLIFNGTGIPNIADNTATSPLTALYFALHTADPSGQDAQTLNEVIYSGYARASLTRNNVSFPVSGNTIVLASDLIFPVCVGNTSSMAYFFSIGVAASGTGLICFSGPLNPSIMISNGATPRLIALTTFFQEI